MSTYAIVKTGGKQYRVEQGQSLLVERLPAKDGGKLSLEPLLYVDGSKVVDGDELAKVTVDARIVGHERGPKLRVVKFRPKRGYKRRTGHRQELTRIEVIGIKLVSRRGKAAEGEKGEPAAKAKAAQGTKAAPRAKAETAEKTEPARKEKAPRAKAAAPRGGATADKAAPKGKAAAEKAAPKGEAAAEKPKRAPARKTESGRAGSKPARPRRPPRQPAGGGKKEEGNGS